MTAEISASPEPDYLLGTLVTPDAWKSKPALAVLQRLIDSGDEPTPVADLLGLDHLEPALRVLHKALCVRLVCHKGVFVGGVWNAEPGWDVQWSFSDAPMDRIIAGASDIRERRCFVQITDLGKTTVAEASLGQGLHKRPPTTPSDLITQAEASRKLQVAAVTIKRYVEKGLLKGFGAERKVSSAEVMRKKAEGSLPLRRHRRAAD